MANIHHELFIAAPAEKIYNALTSEEGLSAWWTPGTLAKPEENSISRFPFGAGYFKEMKITELKPNEHVKWLCLTGAEEWVGTTISFKLEADTKEALLHAHPEISDQLQQDIAQNKGTLLTFVHSDWKEHTPMLAECNYTWGQFLRSLKMLCETGQARPWPNQHRLPSQISLGS